MGATVKKHHTVIDGVPYETIDFPAGEALDLSLELAALAPFEELTVVAGIVIGLMGDDAARANALEVAKEAFSDGTLTDALQRMMRNAREMPGGFSALCKRLMAYTESTHCVLLAGGTPALGNVGMNFDTHFQGRLPHFGKVVLWLWKVLFPVPLLGGAFGTSQRDREQADPTKDSSPSTSTP